MEDTPTSGVTTRALFVGAAIACCIGVGGPYGNMVLRGSYMALDFSTAGAIFLFFLFTFFVHTFLGFLHPRLALKREELVVVYIMGIVGCSIPTMGLTEYLLPIISGGLYYASPENEWAQLIHPYVKSWLVPQDAEAVKFFYEGAPQGYDLPWGAWLIPLAAWIPLVLAIYFSMICIMVVLRRQWIERERLAFPLVQVPLAMIEEDRNQPSIFKPFFKNGLMWIGFALPFIVGSLNALHNYWNFVPDVNLRTSIPLFRNTTSQAIALSFPMLGFSYFVNLDIAFAIWFFNLIARVEQGIFGIVGLTSTQKLYYAGGFPILAHQGMGAMLVLAIFGLWTARPHLRQVLRKAFYDAPQIDDSDEILSYRVAVYGLALSVAFVAAWLWLAGLALWLLPIYLTTMYLVFIAITRVVAEGGIAAARAPLIAADFTTSALGTTAMGPHSLVALGFTFVWAADIRTFVMASCANGLKFAEERLGHRKCGLFWTLALAIAVSLAASIATVLHLSYTYGGINLNGWFFGPTGGPVYPFNFISGHLNNPEGPNLVGWISTVAGGSVMAGLMLARQHFLWWPLHPLGFAVSTISMTNYISFSVFLAWLLKSLILKYGGPALFHRAKPFFLGLILGQFTVAGLWLIIDYLTGMTDNNIYWV
ncbi:MAG: DUF6785 family protein [Candidatus Latescibacterota bacterium]|nr:DUF6785 family protein [Candidatus Latescibacterota bacterium]